MSMHSIISDVSLIDYINLYLDNHPKARLSFGLSCKTLNHIHGENKKCENIAAFILKNYQIVACHPSDYPLWLLVKIQSALGLAETHTIDRHRNLNAQVIHAIWKEGTHALLTESKHTSNRGQIKYVDPFIGKQSRSWEADNKNLLLPILQC